MSNRPFISNGYHLLIVTHSGILAWNQTSLTRIFSSGSSGGILAAKKAANETGLLAIADSQVIILHDVQRGRDKNYCFKGAEGQIRLLEFSPDSQTLFFTTTLHPSVQTYSLPRRALLPPAHTHPSPPTILAVSTTTLLSASASPPTIYLSSLAPSSPTTPPASTVPLLFHPPASTTPVTSASFHPTRPNTFLLGFTDGIVAAYRWRRRSAPTTPFTPPPLPTELSRYIPQPHRRAPGPTISAPTATSTGASSSSNSHGPSQSPNPSASTSTSTSTSTSAAAFPAIPARTTAHTTTSSGGGGGDGGSRPAPPILATSFLPFSPTWRAVC
ncbi:hypothetical protein AOQ84DRAFT_393547, partial [Glonium stellatum]